MALGVDAPEALKESLVVHKHSFRPKRNILLGPIRAR